MNLLEKENENDILNADNIDHGRLYSLAIETQALTTSDDFYITETVVNS